MALKSWYLTVVEAKTQKKVFDKMFFNAPDMNKFIKEQELLTKYPKEDYDIIKELY